MADMKPPFVFSLFEIAAPDEYVSEVGGWALYTTSPPPGMHYKESGLRSGPRRG